PSRSYQMTYSRVGVVMFALALAIFPVLFFREFVADNWALVLEGGRELLHGGRQQKDIRSYDAPHEHPKQQLVGVLLSGPDRVWSVKLSGPADDVGPHREAFRDFVKSFAIDPKDGEVAPKWTAPAEWRTVPVKKGDMGQYAEFRLGKGLHAVRL